PEAAGAQAGDSAQSSPRAGRRGPGLSGMVLAELRTLAAELGIKGTSGMRKGDLIAAIKERQGGDKPAAPVATQAPAEKAQAPAEKAQAEKTEEAPGRPARARRARSAA